MMREFEYDLKSNIIYPSLFNFGHSLRLFPEIQNHFEVIDHTQQFDGTIITSAKTEHEAFILWCGLSQ